MNDVDLNDYQLLLDLIEEAFGNLNDPSLAHFGVKGMKWGVRKDRPLSERKPVKGLGPDQLKLKTKHGEEITITKSPPSAFVQFIARHSERYKNEMNNFAYLHIKDSKGKKVGEAQLQREKDDSINLVWLGINKDSRGKGYASAVMSAGVEFGRQTGAKRLTLEVPGNSPDARHIYQNLGFKFKGESTYTNDKKDSVWGGLYEMEYVFDERVKHMNNGTTPALQRYYERKKELFHHGVKGMKWGVRHDPGHEGEKAKTKKIAKLDKKYEKTANSTAGYIAVNNAIAHHINHSLDAMNQKPEYQVDMHANPKVQKKYLAEYKRELEKACNSAMKDLGTNASGTKQIQISVHGEGYDAGWTAALVDVKHSDLATQGFGIVLTFNAKGQVTGQKIVPLEDVLPPSELKHYGVKGMHWGVRKDRGPADVTTAAKPGRKVKAKGGQRHPASEDAVTAATLHRKAVKSTTDSLSNKELQTLVTRMNLEQQFQNLEKQGVRDSAGKKMAKDFLSGGGKDITLNGIKAGAGAATSALPGGKAAKIGVQIGAAIATAYVNKYSGNKKK